MGEVVSFSSLFAGRARSRQAEQRRTPSRGLPRLPTHHLPELVPLPLPELVNLSTMKDAPAPWHGSPVLVRASLWWGKCIGMEPDTGRLVVMHRVSGEVLFRSYLAAELQRLRSGDPRA